MYYKVIEDRSFQDVKRYVYTGMESKTKEGLLEKAVYAFPQYENLKIIEVDEDLAEDNWNIEDMPF